MQKKVIKRRPKMMKWSSSISLNLTAPEYLDLSILAKIREQSLRRLVANILTEEIAAFKDLIDEAKLEDHYSLLPSLEARALVRGVGRPCLENARTFIKRVNEELLPFSLEDLIKECNE